MHLITSNRTLPEGLLTFIIKSKEAGGHNRSVMPLDVLGCTRATLMHATSITLVCDFNICYYYYYYYYY